MGRAHAAKQALSARIDKPADRLLARLLQRRLHRAASARDRGLVSPRSTWDPELFEAQESLIRRYAAGRSFVDIACMWGVNGACAFLAEAAGASSVTAMDKWPPTPEYLETEQRLGSSVRFVQGDLHDEKTIDEIGIHDVVWSSGLLYHTPHPVMTTARLLELTREYLILGTKSMPDVPGMPGLAVYYSGLPADERQIYRPILGEVADVPFDRDLHAVNWFWGLSPSSMISIAKSIADVEVVEQVDLPWLRRHDDVYIVLRRQER